MQSGDIEQLPAIEHRGTDECHIKIAGARSVRIERLAVGPSVPSYCTAAKYDLTIIEQYLAQLRDGLIELRIVTAKRQSDNASTNGFFVDFRHQQQATKL